MFTKAQAIDSMRHEVRIIQHLAGKVEEAHLSYRPTEGQRSLLELMQYLSCGPIIVSKNIVTGNWDHAPAISEKSQEVTLETFAAAMDQQMEAVVDTLNAFDDDGLAKHECTMPWGTPCSGGEALMNMVLKTFVAYRMQFFLYLKSCGVELSTHNCWIGQDPPR